MPTRERRIKEAKAKGLPIPGEERKKAGLALVMDDIRRELRSLVPDQDEWPRVRLKRLGDGKYQELGKDVLELIAMMAAANRTQKTIAAHLGVHFRTFENWYAENKGDNAVRHAFDRGKAAFEQNCIDLLWAKAQGGGKDAAVCLIYFTKTQLGWQDRPEAPTQAGSVIQFVLPQQMSHAQMIAQYGEVVDTRKQIAPPTIEGEIINVTPASEPVAAPPAEPAPEPKPAPLPPQRVPIESTPWRGQSSGLMPNRPPVTR